MKRPDGQTLFLGLAILAAAGVAGFFTLSGQNGEAGSPSLRSNLTLDRIPFDGQRALEMVQQLCDLGPRMSGSVGMQRQQELLAAHFQGLGGQVEFQRFRIRDPRNGAEVPMANLIVHWHSDRKERILLCAHYDTRPFPDRDPDPRKRKDPFLGANDGASGVAVLAELGRHMPKLNSRYGVDFVLFDGEEYVFDDDRDPYFLGSNVFARQHVQQPPAYSYRWGVLLDMVGDAQLQLYQERHSMSWRDTRPLVQDIWRTARRLGVREFIPRAKYEIRDDHLPLHDVAGIPCCDIIDFDYPKSGSRGSYWHTTDDTPDKCSALSLAKVGWVVHEWLKQVD